MASRIKRVDDIDPKAFHAELAEIVLVSLAKHIPHRNYGRVRDPGKGFYKLASKTFARVVSAYHFFPNWNIGRRKVRTARNKPMVFFPDIKDDPRVADDYARLPRNRRSLSALMSKDEMRRMRKAGRLVVTTRTPELKGEYFVKDALIEATEKIRKAGIGKISGKARDLIKQVRSERGLTYFTFG
jgi:hypothetical protein